jgi:hypothetical protein
VISSASRPMSTKHGEITVGEKRFSRMKKDMNTYGVMTLGQRELLD